MIEYKFMQNVHIPAIAQLERENFSLPWSEDSLYSELSNPLSLWVVAMDGDRLSGYVGSQIVPDEADMMNLAVSSHYRRMGIGENLVSFLVEKLKEREVRSLTLEVRTSNAPAIALYEKTGFVQVGRRPGYYKNPKEDALILRKEWSL